MTKDSATLRAENRRLRRALRVYADRDHWRSIPASCSNPDHQRNLFVTEGWHGWEVAAKALKGTR